MLIVLRTNIFKCNDSYYRLTGTLLVVNYNVRTKNLRIVIKLTLYENYISADGLILIVIMESSKGWKGNVVARKNNI